MYNHIDCLDVFALFCDPVEREDLCRHTDTANNSILFPPFFFARLSRYIFTDTQSMDVVRIPLNMSCYLDCAVYMYVRLRPCVCVFMCAYVYFTVYPNGLLYPLSCLAY